MLIKHLFGQANLELLLLYITFCLMMLMGGGRYA